MSSYARTHRLQVYVEIPPSPLTMHRNKSTFGTGSTLHVHGASLKENTPLTGSTTASTLNSNKRKLSDRDLAASLTNFEYKKPKLAAKVVDMNAKTTDQSITDFPNGYFYCHQCVKKRDISMALQCTFKDTKGRCKIKYCKPCLRNRYGEDADAIKATGEHSYNKVGHVHGEGFIFKCPKCQDICNCRRCRKAKGLKPTGNMTTIAHRTGGSSVASVLRSNPAAVGILPGKGQQLEPKLKVKRPAAAKSSEGSSSSNSAPRPKGRPPGRPKATLKSLPSPTWTSIANTLALSLSQAESRIQIREFVLRFSGLLDMSTGNLEELECVAGMKARTYGYSECEEDNDEMVEWVSESCVKGVVLGLLGLLAADKQSAEGQAIKKSIKEIRGSGANLSKIWSILDSMRDALSTSESHRLSFPDPVPPPSSSTVHTTRSTRTTARSRICIAHSAQMVPVLVALINSTIETRGVRQEIEEGFKELREVMKEKSEKVKAENERWEFEKEEWKDKGADVQDKNNNKQDGSDGEKKSDLTKSKKDNDKDKVATEVGRAKRVVHKQTLASLDHALQIAAAIYAPRFAPLGRDCQGRVYWALSPGIKERELALHYLAEKSTVDKYRSKTKQNGRKWAPDEDERRSLRRWSWFVAVWGRRPPLENVKPTAMKEVNSDDEGDDGEEKWWGFWEPEEIRRLAGWIGNKSQLSDASVDVNQKRHSSGDSAAWSHESSPLSGPEMDQDTSVPDLPPTKDEVQGLVKGLQDYADILEWRVKSVDSDELKGREKLVL